MILSYNGNLKVFRIFTNIKQERILQDMKLKYLNYKINLHIFNCYNVNLYNDFAYFYTKSKKTFKYQLKSYIYIYLYKQVSN